MRILQALERTALASLPWATFNRLVVLPWALDGRVLDGEVLEVGAGSGDFSRAIIRRFPDTKLVVTDADPVATDIAGRRLRMSGHPSGRVAVRQADMAALPFGREKFDAVIGFGMLHHVPLRDEALREVHRVLRPGCFILGHDLMPSPMADFLHRTDPAPYQMVSSHEVAEDLDRAGFESVRVEKGLGGMAFRFFGVKPL